MVFMSSNTVTDRTTECFNVRCNSGTLHCVELGEVHGLENSVIFA